MRKVTRDKLTAKIFETREEMGKVAADDISVKINELLEQKEHINIVFAAAPSQNDFLASLREKDIKWDRINAFHMDEYIGLDDDAPQLFGNFLRDKLFAHVPFRNVFYLNGQADDQEQECKRYADLLEKYPTDICILGIGENTHLAFCDPHVAYFDDPKDVKVVDLDEENRQQQVSDGMFPTLDGVPTHALTMTIPALMRADYTYTIVPTKAKAQAVYHTLESDVQEKYPSTRLRKHREGILYTDEAGASKLPN